jgi:endonuclease/exonuclease/phosphatase family metal-dependent hydrolase/2'-5' RNA ligase
MDQPLESLSYIWVEHTKVASGHSPIASHIIFIDQLSALCHFSLILKTPIRIAIITEFNIMAFGNDTSPTAIDSYDTALCVIPLAEQCSEIDKLRSLYDKGYGKWPPHINLVYPFVDPASLPQAKDRMRSKLAELTSATTFHVRLNEAGSFTHHTTHNIHLRQQKSDPDGLESLRSLALGSLGQLSTSYNFHLTIGQSEDETEPKRDFLTSKAGLIPHFDFNISQLVILIRERKPGQGPSSSRMRLWSTIELPGSSSTANKTPLTEFWLTTKKQEEESLDNDEEDALSRRTTFPTLSNGEIRSSATYMFNSVLQKWLPYDSELQNDIDLTDVVVSSYNILVDSENPSGRDRYPLLLSAILSEAALANILVLQEVSDDFLSYLLADANLRLRYPFTSHGPPSQPDVGPMPSLRNVVVLSCWSFSCEMLSLLRKHKAAVVATFPVAINTGSYPSVPLVVAGVHLTSGLTDGAVAAKKTQLQLLKSHLNGRYAQNSWIIAGDFNMTTSRHTVNTAVNNGLISKETQKTLQSMEVMFSNIGLLDTWAIARVEAVDCTPRRNSDDLFEGEDGATFDPSKNVLAAAASGTSNNRPQRYDRILVRPRGTLQITQFDQFGFPELQEGVKVVPSDHWGIRASMKMDTTVMDNSTSDQHVLVSHLAETRLASGSIADVSDMTASLDAHGMFLTDQEIENRKEAFTLVKEVVLGSADDRVTIASDIPMVMVPVGSYALGVWTAASDIDCLCIGSISSKTFFRLSRQRINRAEERGVRLLRKVNAASGTMFELSVNGVHMDLQYCPAARVVER